ncbi:hypothetical protein C7T36_03690 [Rhodococcus sp. AD45-ID]|nr:hypothetical protein [Rhodococcus sp. MS16]PSR41408.1 hypothetical protein C7T36_03690 [Rhodococcus sp. AD45-ID]ROZ49149.1 hypothetical protein EEB13_04185 [Rhodococcus sp. WS3]RZL22562.1 MAG: hypothetical protein EOP31_23995 [Rhodococcus sp. (in: high G+C Gram-positive bacteria)]
MTGWSASAPVRLESRRPSLPDACSCVFRERYFTELAQDIQGVVRWGGCSELTVCAAWPMVI